MNTLSTNPIVTVGAIHALNEYQDSFEVLLDTEDNTVSLINLTKDEGITVDVIQIDNLIALLTLAKKRI